MDIHMTITLADGTKFIKVVQEMMESKPFGPLTNDNAVVESIVKALRPCLYSMLQDQRALTGEE